MRFWTDISGIQLDENSSWIQAIPEGKKYNHPLYGEIDFTDPVALEEYARNVNENIRGTQLDVDYDHKKRSDEAAGWVKGARYEPGRGVFVLVEWTKQAAQKIRDKAYRYFSPEFVERWKNAQGQEYRHVLLGGALTNRPFLKDILPINLSEVLAEDSDAGGNMDEKLKKALIARFGLSEDATDEQVMAAVEADPTPFDVSKLRTEKQDDGSVKVVGDGTTGELVVTPEPVKASENDDEEVKKLAESNPVIAKMLEEQEATRKRLADTEKAIRLSEVDKSLGSLDRVPPVVTDLLRPILMSASVKLSEDILTAVKKLNEVGLVDTSQQSSGRQNNQGGGSTDNEDNAVTKFLTAIDEQVESKKLSYQDAMLAVREEKPELYEAYEQAVEEGVEA